MPDTTPQISIVAATRPAGPILLASFVLSLFASAFSLLSVPLSSSLAALPADAAPIGWLFILLTFAIGLPFVAIAATAPLMQTWFARTTHPHARDCLFYTWPATPVTWLL